MKRKNQFTVDIANPCTQSWDNMPPVDNGRYCGHCTKKIIDFTKLADHEVVRIFLDSSGPVCGRFTQGQLNRDLLALEKERTNALVPVLLVSTALAAGVASNAVANHRSIDDIRQMEQRDTGGTSVKPEAKPDTENSRDTTFLPGRKEVSLFPDAADRFNPDKMVMESSSDIDRDMEVAVMGFVGPTVPNTKRLRRKTEQRYQMKFAEAIRSKPLRITTPPSADDAKP